MRNRAAEPEQREDGCPVQVRATEYVRGELRDGELGQFEEHLASCPSCRELVVGLRDTVSLLAGSAPPPSEWFDVADRVLARIDERDWGCAPSRRPASSRTVLALVRGPLASIAAVLAVASLLFWAVRGGARLTDEGLATGEDTAAPTGAATLSTNEPATGGIEGALDQARDWLLSVQETDGAWDPRRWGGSEEYQIALTGLATLALAGDDGRLARDATWRAVEFLLKRQSSDGHFGERTRGSLYNHALGMLALTELAKSSESLREPVRRAARYLVAAQTAEGAWGYVSGEGTIPNDSISVWALQALVRARELDPMVDRRAVEKGFDWFERRVRLETPPTYLGYGGHVCGEGTAPLVAFAVLSRGERADIRTLHLARDRLARQREAAGGLCFYDSYFVARSLLADDHPALEESRVRALRALERSQVTTGRFSGSWEPGDRWSPVGGRLYTTALAALALEPPGAGGRG